MSFFSEPNKDALAVAPDNVTRGKSVGFLEAFDASFQAQTKAAAMFGIQEAMRNLDDEQRNAMRKAGLEDVPSLSTRADDPLRAFTDLGYDYLDAARFFENGGTPEMAQRINEYDAKIADIRKRYPDLNLRTANEMWHTVRSQAQDAEAKASTMRAKDWGGPVGSFLGGIAGSFNPNTDPLNLATAPIGGGGATIAGRVALQAGVQGVTEAANQVLGVQEQRQLLGLDSGFADAATRIGGAAIGGAFVQGLGEAVGFGARKLFKRSVTPIDPPPKVLPKAPERLPVTAPEVAQPGIPDKVEVAAAKLQAFPDTFDEYVHAVSPTSTTRIGKARTNIDMADVSTQLTDWAGPAPWELKPKTDTAAIKPLTDFNAAPPMTTVVRDANIDALARRADPEVTSKYDQLANEKQMWKSRLDNATTDRDRIVAAEQTKQLDDISQKIAELDHKIANSGAMKGKKYNKQKADLVAEQKSVAETISKRETPEMSIIRQNMMEVDHRMRDLAEPLSRAYSRARNKWAATETEHAGIVKMMRDGSTQNRAVEDVTSKFLPGKSLEERIPLMQSREASPDLKKDADAADVVAAVIAKHIETMSGAYEQARSGLTKILSDNADTKELTLPGYKTTLHLDNDHVLSEDGKKITVREALQQQLDGEEDLKAVTSCSIV